jgi:plasmid stabilization system protein ParE
MAQVRWTFQAVEDLESIVLFIAKDSSHYARLFVFDVFSSVERVVKFPNSGRIVPELNDPAVRELILGSYRIIYRFQKDTIELLAVYHTARIFDSSKINAKGD